MNPHQLQDNTELIKYLVWLSDELKTKGFTAAAEEVYIASRFGGGSPSEFFQEAYESLKTVEAQCTSVLNSSQLAELISVMDQIEEAFKKIGGA